MNEKLTDEQVEKEIQELKNDPHVKLSKLNEKIKYKRRQALYNLRWHKKHGKQLEEAGITVEMLKSMGEEL